jgi:hypothetical protein
MELGPIAGPLVFVAGIVGLIALVSSLTKREHGGPVVAGRPYIVGEKRPEIFVPSQSGTIIPSIDGLTVAGAGGTMVAAASSGGSSSRAPIASKPGRDIVVVGDLFTAKTMARDPEFDSVVYDSVSRQKGSLLNS